MERGQDGCNKVEPHPRVFIPLEQGSQLALLGESAHDDHMLQWLAVHNEVGHAKVHIGCETAIELDLAVAVCEARATIPEVQKAKVDGLVKLVDLVAEEDHNRNMRLHYSRL